MWFLSFIPVLLSFCSSSGPPYKDPTEGFVSEPVKTVELNQKSLMELRGGINFVPQFSPDGEKLVYHQRIRDKEGIRDNLFVAYVNEGKKALILDQQGLLDLGVDSLNGLKYWIDDHHYQILLFGKKGAQRKVYDTRTEQFVDPDTLVREEEKEKKDNGKKSVHFSAYDAAQKIIGEKMKSVDPQMLSEHLKRAPVVLDSDRFMVVQIPDPAEGSAVWFIDFEKMEMKPLLEFSGKFQDVRFLGGEMMGNNIVFRVQDNVKSYLFSYSFKDRKLSKLLAVEGKPGIENFVYDSKRKKYVLLAFTVETPFLNEARSLYLYDGDKLNRVILPEVPCGIEFNAQLETMALSVCGAGEEAILVQHFDLNKG